jgi:hypothetical protein
LPMPRLSAKQSATAARGCVRRAAREATARRGRRTFARRRVKVGEVKEARRRTLSGHRQLGHELSHGINLLLLLGHGRRRAHVLRRGELRAAVSDARSANGAKQARAPV